MAHIGLALTTALAAWVNAGLLGYTLKKRGAWISDQDSLRFVSKILISALAMAALLFVLTPEHQTWQQWGGITRLTVLMGLIVTGVVLFLGLSALQGQTPKKLVDVVLFDRKNRST